MIVVLIGSLRGRVNFLGVLHRISIMLMRVYWQILYNCTGSTVFYMLRIWIFYIVNLEIKWFIFNLLSLLKILFFIIISLGSCQLV
jgi:hypothetical protein